MPSSPPSFLPLVACTCPARTEQIVLPPCCWERGHYVPKSCVCVPKSLPNAGGFARSHVALLVRLQVFESVDEVEQTEADAQLEDGKHSKIPNGTVPNGTCSPDSGHPSSQNFSIASGFSERSFSNEDSALETNKSSASSQGKAAGSDVPGPQDPDGARQEEKLQGQDSLEAEFPTGGSVDFVPVGASSAGVLRDRDAVALTVVESWADREAEKQSLVESEDNLSEEPEMESLYPQLDSLAVADLANSEAAAVSSMGVTYSVSTGLSTEWVSSWVSHYLPALPT